MFFNGSDTLFGTVSVQNKRRRCFIKDFDKQDSESEA
jgi:hypothetical protein